MSMDINVYILPLQDKAFKSLLLFAADNRSSQRLYLQQKIKKYNPTVDNEKHHRATHACGGAYVAH